MKSADWFVSEAILVSKDVSVVCIDAEVGWP